jgi:hypothetical protein
MSPYGSGSKDFQLLVIRFSTHHSQGFDFTAFPIFVKGFGATNFPVFFLLHTGYPLPPIISRGPQNLPYSLFTGLPLGETCLIHSAAGIITGLSDMSRDSAYQFPNSPGELSPLLHRLFLTST